MRKFYTPDKSTLLQGTLGWLRRSLVSTLSLVASHKNTWKPVDNAKSFADFFWFSFGPYSQPFSGICRPHLLCLLCSLQSTPSTLTRSQSHLTHSQGTRAEKTFIPASTLGGHLSALSIFHLQLVLQQEASVK